MDFMHLDDIFFHVHGLLFLAFVKDNVFTLMGFKIITPVM